MSNILVDGLSSITLHNGIVRVDCVTVGANGEQRPAGSLLIPAGVAGSVMQTLANGMQELQKKIAESAAAPKPVQN